jgi:large subunit ribosomal protein L4
VWEHVVALQAGRRRGTACTKTRGEVSGSNAKPWRQKGTGRARAGEKRSPIWRGGGVVFGPRPRDYSKKINKKAAKNALRKAFSERVINGDVIVVDTFAVADGKTKSFVALLESITPELQTLVLSPRFDEKTLLAGRNVEDSALKSSLQVNTEDILRYRKIVVTPDALTQLADRMVLNK